MIPFGKRIEMLVDDDLPAETNNVYADNVPWDQLYTNAARPVPGAEHILVAMPMPSAVP